MNARVPDTLRRLTFAALAGAAAAGALTALPLLAGAAESRAADPAPLRARLGDDDTAREAMSDHARSRLVRAHVAAARRYAELSGRRVPTVAPARAARLPEAALRARTRELRAEARELDVSIPPVLRQVAECESHGNPRAIGGGGAFRGAFQFMRSTWASVGGEGDPAAAPIQEQYRRAAILMARSGSSPWPVCGA